MERAGTATSRKVSPKPTKELQKGQDQDHPPNPILQPALKYWQPTVLSKDLHKPRVESVVIYD
jgi:hypothetical protein